MAPQGAAPDGPATPTPTRPIPLTQLSTINPYSPPSPLYPPNHSPTSPDAHTHFSPDGMFGHAMHPLHSTMSRGSHTSHLSRRVSRLSHISPESLNHVTSHEDPELPRPPRPPSPPQPGDNVPPPVEEVTHTRLAAHYSGLVLASMVGLLIRLGLEALATYDGSVIFPLAWAQGVGCGIMGFALSRKNEVVEIYPPLYTFFTTGIAGSVTTFSSWMLEGYQAFANFDNYNRKGLHDTVDGVAYSLSTMAISLASLILGEHLAALVPPLPVHWLQGIIPMNQAPKASPASSNSSADLPAAQIADGTQAQADGYGEMDAPDDDEEPYEPRNPLSGLTFWLDIGTIGTAVLAYLAALLIYFLGPVAWRHRVTFALLLSPPGAMLRFLLANINTRRPFVDRFPMGTFLVNIPGTLVIAGVFAAQRRPGLGGVGCNGLYALQQGFCGCLTTVSTFAVESRAIRNKAWRWFYVVTSVVVGHICVLAVVGGVGWGEGYVDQCAGQR